MFRGGAVPVGSARSLLLGVSRERTHWMIHVELEAMMNNISAVGAGRTHARDTAEENEKS